MDDGVRKFITCMDPYGTSKYGWFVCWGKRDGSIVDIVSPQSLKSRWDVFIIGAVQELRVNKDCPTGYYTRKGHYELLKNEGYFDEKITQFEEKNADGWNDDKLKSLKHTINTLEKLSDESDDRHRTWYAEGQYIHGKLESKQNLLHRHKEL